MNNKTIIKNKHRSCKAEINESEKLAQAALMVAIKDKNFNIKHAVTGLIFCAVQALYFFCPTIEEADEILFMVRSVSIKAIKSRNKTSKKARQK